MGGKLIGLQVGAKCTYQGAQVLHLILDHTSWKCGQHAAVPKGDVCLFDGQPSSTDISGDDNALTELRGKICIRLATMLASLQTHLCCVDASGHRLL